MSTPAGGFDLGAVAPVSDLEDEGTAVHLRDIDDELMYFTPDGEKEERPVTITVAGSYSKRYRKAQNAHTTRTMKGARRGTRVTGEALQEQMLDLAATCVIAWDGFFDAGKILSCNKENAVRVFQQAPWFLEQVQAAQVDHASFFGKS